MLPMIVDQVVGEGWLTFEALNSFIGIAESTPGPFAVNTATLVGFQVGFDNFGYVGALFGAVFTTLGVVLPSFLIILVIAKHFNNFMKVSWVKDALTGIKAIVVGLIFAVVLKLLITNVIGSITEVKFDLFALIIVVVIFTLKLVFKKLSPILLIVLSGLLGILFYFIF